MKFLIIITSFIAPFIAHGQMVIEARVIPWKVITETDFRITLRIDSDTLLDKNYKSTDIGKPGQYPEILFKIDSVKNNGTLSCEIRAGNKRLESENWALSFNSCKLMGKEKRVELEFHFQEYEYGQEYLDEFTIKKIFEDSINLKIIPIWDIRKNSILQYVITNNYRYKLYGQSQDGNFDGKLYKKSHSNKMERVYAGGYDYNLKPAEPLYQYGYVISKIRDHRAPDKFFRLEDSGEFAYHVLLGFKDYEVGSRYGGLPYFSVENNRQLGTTKKYIKEYFELVHRFKIE